ncbi:uncharacterized protein MONBRDRAFT_10762 [Monosiga brevicollis MX1]|uniref:Uncharacterized protein n=1 Tax=Monosiga brevicollis TaxID=81824 RepID=A9V758_MONBE|nr:uncharacterized protein MONBRDRAFT_10762 [Monosiga brevicollis MX1]EDQ86733.1 predicted protein [Monosiga brevicollis MX1]|eukprot:XP_001748569.1 hypothetical protein [Monosiga brevicollis MX1]
MSFFNNLSSRLDSTFTSLQTQFESVLDESLAREQDNDEEQLAGHAPSTVPASTRANADTQKQLLMTHSPFLREYATCTAVDVFAHTCRLQSLDSHMSLCSTHQLDRIQDLRQYSKVLSLDSALRHALRTARGESAALANRVLEAVEPKVQHHATQIESLTLEVRRLEEQLEQAQHDAASTDTQARDEQAPDTALEAQVTQLEELLREAQESHDNVLADIQKARSERNKAQARHETIAAELEELAASFQTLEQAHGALKVEHDTALEKTVQLQTQLQELEAQHTATCAERDDLSQKLTGLEQQQTDSATLAADLDASRDHPSQLEQQVVDLQQQLEALQAEKAEQGADEQVDSNATVGPTMRRLLETIQQFNQTQRLLGKQRQICASLQCQLQEGESRLPPSQSSDERVQESNDQLNRSQRLLQQALSNSTAADRVPVSQSSDERVQESNDQLNRSQRLLQQALSNSTAADRVLVSQSSDERVQESNDQLNRSQRLLQQALSNSAAADRVPVSQSSDGRVQESNDQLNRSQRLLQQALSNSAAADWPVTLLLCHRARRERDLLEVDLRSLRDELADAHAALKTEQASQVALQQQATGWAKNEEDMQEQIRSLQEEVDELTDAMDAAQKSHNEEMRQARRTLEEKMRARDAAEAELRAQLDTVTAEVSYCQGMHQQQRENSANETSAALVEQIRQLQQQQATAQKTHAAKVKKMNSDFYDALRAIEAERDDLQTQLQDSQSAEQAALADVKLEAEHELELGRIEEEHRSELDQLRSVLATEPSDHAEMSRDVQAQVRELQLQLQEAQEVREQAVQELAQRGEVERLQLQDLQAAQTSAVAELERELAAANERNFVLEEEVRERDVQAESARADALTLQDRLQALQHELDSVQQKYRELAALDRDSLHDEPRQRADPALADVSAIPLVEPETESGMTADEVAELQKQAQRSLRQVEQLTQQTLQLQRHKERLEEMNTEQAHRVQTSEREQQLLQRQLNDALKEIQRLTRPASKAVPGDAVAVDMPGADVKPTRSAGHVAQGGDVLQGCVNCIQLLTDGKVSRQVAMGYLGGVHLLLLFIIFRCYLSTAS